MISVLLAFYRYSPYICKKLIFRFSSGYTKQLNGGNMKRIIYWGLIVLCFPSILCAQDKVEIPVWNVGDKWVFNNSSPYIKNQGAIEVVSANQNTYTVKFFDDICVAETQGFETIIFDKSTLHRIYTLSGNMREEYKKGLKTIFNFPLNPGKQWEYTFSAVPLHAEVINPQLLDYYNIYKAIGWEDAEVQAGKFRAIKLEVTVGHEAKGSTAAFEATHLYWYSPDVKQFVKCQYDPIARNFFSGLFNWELTSFKVKK
jgi:hypothetical protein